MSKTILVVGLTGSGKSTTSNSIINKSGEILQLQTPFTTSDGANGCTLHFQVNITPEEAVLDTVGFGDPQFTPNQILEEFKKALDRTGNRVTHVVFVVRKGRFSNELVQFFKAVQEKVLQNKCVNNSLVLFTDCEEGWVEKQNDQFIKRAIDNCNGRYIEYKLRFDSPDDEEDDRRRNITRRQKAIDRFLLQLNGFSFREIDLSHVQTAEFEHEYKQDIVPEMIRIMTEMFGRMQEQNQTMISQFQDQMNESNRYNREVLMELKRQHDITLEKLINAQKKLDELQEKKVSDRQSEGELTKIKEEVETLKRTIEKQKSEIEKKEPGFLRKTIGEIRDLVTGVQKECIIS